MDTIKFVKKNGLTLKGTEHTLFILKEIWDDKVYDMPNFHIKPGMDIVDIGANQGFFTVYAAHLGAFVYAFEPYTKNYDILKWNVSKNNLKEKVKLFRKAVSGKSGEVNLFIPIKNKYETAVVSTSFSFVTETKNLWFKRGYESELVNSVSLDEIFKNHVDGKCDLLKIDCEGEEYNILKAASLSTLNQIKRIVVETHKGYDELELLNLLTKSNFEIIYFKERIQDVHGNGYIKCVKK